MAIRAHTGKREESRWSLLLNVWASYLDLDLSVNCYASKEGLNWDTSIKLNTSFFGFVTLMKQLNFRHSEH